MVAGADDIRVAALEDYFLEHALFSLGNVESHLSPRNQSVCRPVICQAFGFILDQSDSSVFIDT